MKRIVLLIMLIIGSACCYHYIKAHISQTKNSFDDAKRNITVSNADGFINGHGYVDLGLPSGLKWATCNIGASVPEEYGNYYAWGETTTKKKYSEENCTVYSKDTTWLKQSGIIDDSGNLTPQYDAANVNWGGSWRMPTRIEYEELMNCCRWGWKTLNGVDGVIFTGKNDKSIFIPLGGCVDESSVDFTGDDCMMWTATVDKTDPEAATGLCIGKDWHNINWFDRFLGLTIRPVAKF